MIIALKTPSEILAELTLRIKQTRLEENLTQEQLADWANVSVAVLRKFEKTGKISFPSFVKLAFVLGLTDKFLDAFNQKKENYASLDELLDEKKNFVRKRATSSNWR